MGSLTYGLTEVGTKAIFGILELEGKQPVFFRQVRWRPGAVNNKPATGFPDKKVLDRRQWYIRDSVNKVVSAKSKM